MLHRRLPAISCEIEAVQGRCLVRTLSEIKMNATKSMTGHCLGAAGGIEAIATIKAIQTGMLHPTINLDEPEEEGCGYRSRPTVAKPHKVKVALSNSFGFGGHNSSLVFAAYS